MVLKDCSMLITGSNMSGKTSFIRTIGINVITAQVLNTCFAEEFALTQMKIYSAIRGCPGPYQERYLRDLHRHGQVDSERAPAGRTAYAAND